MVVKLYRTKNKNKPREKENIWYEERERRGRKRESVTHMWLWQCDINAMLFMIEEIQRCKFGWFWLNPLISDQNKSFAGWIERLLRCESKILWIVWCIRMESNWHTGYYFFLVEKTLDCCCITHSHKLTFDMDKWLKIR